MAIFLMTLFIVVCVLLIIVVLLQKGRGGGLGAVFGGAGSSAFGTRTGDVFTWVTIVLTGLFLLLAVAMVMYFRPAPTMASSPIFSPADRNITKTELVSIQSPTKDAAIYYTIDDSEPAKESANSTQYVGPFRVKPGTVIKARAYATNMLPSEVVRAYYGQPETQPAPTTMEAQPQTAPAELPATVPAG